MFSNNFFVLMLRLFIVKLVGLFWTAVHKKKIPAVLRDVTVSMLFSAHSLSFCAARVIVLPTNMTPLVIL